MCNHLTFDIEGDSSAKLHKVYNGLINECCNMADKYSLNYPEGGRGEKATFLAAVHFFDLLFFENNFAVVGGV